MTDANTPIKTEGDLSRVPHRDSPPGHTISWVLCTTRPQKEEGRSEPWRPQHEAMSSQERTAPPAQAWGHPPIEGRPAAGTHTYIHAYACAHTNEGRPQCLSAAGTLLSGHCTQAMLFLRESAAGPSPPHSPLYNTVALWLQPLSSSPNSGHDIYALCTQQSPVEPSWSTIPFPANRANLQGQQ